MKIKPCPFFLLALGLARGADVPAKPAAACPHCAEAVAASTATANTGPVFSRESLYQLDAEFTDDSGRAFTLGELRDHPVVLDMFFTSCGYACPLAVTDMLALQSRLPAALRGEARFVLISFDAGHDTPAVLARYRAERHLDGQWILLHGDGDAVRELAAVLGVKYRQDADGAFSHSNLLTVLNPRGEIVHQRVGLQDGLDATAAALAISVK